MPAILLTIAAAIILAVGVIAFNASAGERRIAEARAHAIEAQADADAAATRQAAALPALLVIGGTIVGIVWGVAACIRAKQRPLPAQRVIVEHKVYMLPAPARPDFYSALSGPSYLELSDRIVDEHSKNSYQETT